MYSLLHVDGLYQGVMGVGLFSTFFVFHIHQKEWHHLSLTLLSVFCLRFCDICFCFCHCKNFFELFWHPVFLSLLSNTITEYSIFSGGRSFQDSGPLRPVDAVHLVRRLHCEDSPRCSSAFLLCPLLFALAIFLNEFECPLTGRVMASHNRSTKLHKVDQQSKSKKRNPRLNRNLLSLGQIIVACFTRHGCTRAYRLCFVLAWHFLKAKSISKHLKGKQRWVELCANANHVSNNHVSNHVSILSVGNIFHDVLPTGSCCYLLRVSPAPHLRSYREE